MIRLLIQVFRTIRRINPFSFLLTWTIFKAYGVRFKRFSTSGIPYVKINNGRMFIGDNFKINNGYVSNVIGRQQRCIFSVKGGELKIGDNVGMSASSIVCRDKVTIGNNIKLGGNVVIYDTDFHSQSYKERIASPEIYDNVKTKEVIIRDNVFIGAHSIILKGSIIGQNSIIGAGSVVSGTIPSNEIWAGNPAKYIKDLNIDPPQRLYTRG